MTGDRCRTKDQQYDEVVKWTGASGELSVKQKLLSNRCQGHERKSTDFIE